MHQNNTGSGQWPFFNPPQRVATPNIVSPPQNVAPNPMEMLMQSMAQYMSQQFANNLSASQQIPKNNSYNVANNDPAGNLLNINQINNHGHNINNMANPNISRNINNPNYNIDNNNMAFVNPPFNCPNNSSKGNNVPNDSNLSNFNISNSNKNAKSMIGDITQYLNTNVNLINKNGPNSQEAILVRQLICVLVQQMVNNNMIDDVPIVRQFINYLEGKITNNSLNVQKNEIFPANNAFTNEFDIRPLSSSNSFVDSFTTKKNSSQQAAGVSLTQFTRNNNINSTQNINNFDDNDDDTDSAISNISDDEDNIIISKLIKIKKDDPEKCLPCGICRKKVIGSSIKCIKCDKWIHKECSGLTGKLNDPKNKVSAYVCPNCRDDTLVVSEDQKYVLPDNMKMKTKPKIGPASFKARLIKMEEDTKSNTSAENSSVLQNTATQSKSKRGRKKNPISEESTPVQSSDEAGVGKKGLKNKSKVKKNSENFDEDYQPDQELIYDPPKRSCTRNISYAHIFDYNQSSNQPFKSKKSESINSDANSSVDFVPQLEVKKKRKSKLSNVKAANDTNDYNAMPSLESIHSDKLIGEVRQERAIATVIATIVADDVNIQVIPSLNFMPKPDLREIYFGSVALIPEVVIEWLHMVSPNLQGNNCLQCVFCQTLFKQSTDFIQHVKLEHTDLLFAVGKQIPEDVNKVFFLGCRHCNFQTYDLTLMIIHFESQHGLSDISDGSKLPPRPPILLSTNMTRVMPNDPVVSDESYSCFDCDMILTGPDGARSLLNHVLVDHPDTEHCNGCFVRMMRFVRPSTNATNAQVMNDDNYSQLRVDTFGCLYCNYLTECSYEALAHNITVHLIKKILYTCPHCEYKFIFKNRMMKHLERMHPDMDQCYCTVSIVEDLQECFIENRLALGF